jgi:hypothetical protein
MCPERPQLFPVCCSTINSKCDRLNATVAVRGTRISLTGADMPNHLEFTMGAFGCALSILAALFLTVGLIPFLGWLNWFTSLPLSILGVIFCYLALRDRPGTPIAQMGLVASVLLLCITLFRLALGGGLL